MSSVNKVIIIGNVGQDPEIKTTKGGMEIANFSVATQKNSVDKKETVWHNCVAFGKIADIIGKYVAKGSKLYLEGTLDYSKWTDKRDVERTVTKIIVNQVQFLSSRSDEKPASLTRKTESTPDAEDDNLPF